MVWWDRVTRRAHGNWGCGRSNEKMSASWQVGLARKLIEKSNGHRKGDRKRWGEKGGGEVLLKKEEKK